MENAKRLLELAATTVPATEPYTNPYDRSNQVSDRVDAKFPYPWHHRAAQELHGLLAKTFVSKEEVQEIATKAGLPLYDINMDDTVYFVWRSVLDNAANMGAVRKLVETAADTASRLPQEKPKRLSELLPVNKGVLGKQVVEKINAFIEESPDSNRGAVILAALAKLETEGFDSFTAQLKNTVWVNNPI